MRYSPPILDIVVSLTNLRLLFCDPDGSAPAIVDVGLREFGDGVTMVDIPYLVEKETETGIEALPTIVNYARTVFGSVIKGLNIIGDVYEEKMSDEAERSLFLRNAYDFGKPWIAVDESLPYLRMNPRNNKRFIIGWYPSITRFLAADLSGHISEKLSRRYHCSLHSAMPASCCYSLHTTMLLIVSILHDK